MIVAQQQVRTSAAVALRDLVEKEKETKKKKERKTARKIRAERDGNVKNRVDL